MCPAKKTKSHQVIYHGHNGVYNGRHYKPCDHTVDYAENSSADGIEGPEVFAKITVLFDIVTRKMQSYYAEDDKYGQTDNKHDYVSYSAVHEILSGSIGGAFEEFGIDEVLDGSPRNIDPEGGAGICPALPDSRELISVEISRVCDPNGEKESYQNDSPR